MFCTSQFALNKEFLTSPLLFTSKKMKKTKQWCRRRGWRGCNRTLKSFDLVKIGENPIKSGQISENLVKLPKNLSKNGANMLWFENNGAQFDKCRPNDMKSFFLEVTFFEVFFGQVWENPGKIPSHHQKCACSYTYEIKFIPKKIVL